MLIFFQRIINVGKRYIKLIIQDTAFPAGIILK